MGLVLAIFCFIIGIPMFLGGLGLISIGGQEYNEAEFVGQKRFNEANGACESLYEKNGTIGEDIPYLEECTAEANELKSNIIKDQKDIATTKIVGGGLLMLFAFLIMWGGNRTRRPKEVRIRYD